MGSLSDARERRVVFGQVQAVYSENKCVRAGEGKVADELVGGSHSWHERVKKKRRKKNRVAAGPPPHGQQ